jgi:hypothetical protein
LLLTLTFGRYMSMVYDPTQDPNWAENTNSGANPLASIISNNGSQLTPLLTATENTPAKTMPVANTPKSVLTMTPEQLISAYGVDSGEAGISQLASSDALKAALLGSTFNSSDENGGYSLTFTPEFMSSEGYNMIGPSDRAEMKSQLSQSNPEAYAQYQAFNQMLNQVYPQSMAASSKPNSWWPTTLGGRLTLGGIGLVAGAMGGAALAGGGAAAGAGGGGAAAVGAGEALSGSAIAGGYGGMDAMLAGGYGASLGGGLEAGGAAAGAAGLGESVLGGEGIEAAAGNGMGAWTEPSAQSNWLGDLNNLVTNANRVNSLYNGLSGSNQSTTGSFGNSSGGVGGQNWGPLQQFLSKNQSTPNMTPMEINPMDQLQSIIKPYGGGF